MNETNIRERGNAQPLSKEQQIENLERLKAKKQERMRMMLLRSRKNGQIKTLRYFSYLITIEIRKQDEQEGKRSLKDFSKLIFSEMDKEQKELEVIDEDLRDLKREINAYEYWP